MLIRLNLQPRSWTHKPTSKEVAYYIKKDMANHIREVTPEELMTAIERGQTFTPGVLTGSTADTWQSQQLLCADIDNGEHKTNEQGQKVFVPVNDPMTSEEALQIMFKYGIVPYFMYYSFSQNTEGKAYGVEKFRIMVILDKPIIKPDAIRAYTERLISIFNTEKSGVADTSPCNLDRLFFGSVSGSIFYKSGTVTPLSSLESLPKQTPTVATSRPIYNSISVNNGCFDLLECLKFIDPDDRQVWYKVGMALKHEGFTFEDWDSWASQSTKHDEKDSLRVWSSFHEDRKAQIITGAYITKLAKDNGYIPPKQRPKARQPTKTIDWNDFLLL